MLHLDAITRGRAVWALSAALLLAGCGDEASTPLSSETQFCEIDTDLLSDGGVVPDGIPALTGPNMVPADHARADYLASADRVLGVVVGGEARAYPHRILWWHEIVNDRFEDGTPVTVSFCPLTGSGLAWDSRVGGRAVEFGVSGLLFANNLVMFDRDTRALYGPQMSVEGRCGDFLGASPSLVAVREMNWGRWKTLYPDTRVVGDDTGFNRAYNVYPYGTYDRIDNERLLVDMDVDASRPMKERVLGVRTSGGGRAFPLGELRELGERVAVNDHVDGLGPVVVFYEADFGQQAVAYHARAGATSLTFEVFGDAFRDMETGSTWDLAGEAREGSLAGTRLEPVTEAYVAFWFAWRHFEPQSSTFDAESVR